MSKKNTKSMKVNVVVEPAKKTKKVAKWTGKRTGLLEVAMPDGFSFAKHTALKKGDFKDEAIYCEHRAEQMNFKAKVWNEKAKEIRELGSPSERKKKKQVIKLSQKMDELKKQLAAQGIDVEALLAAEKS